MSFATFVRLSRFSPNRRGDFVRFFRHDKRLKQFSDDELAAMFTSWHTVRSYLFKRNAELGAVYVARLLEGARGLWDEYALTNGLLTTAQDELSETPGSSGRAKD